MWWVSTGHGDGNNRKNDHCNWCCAATMNGEHPTGFKWCKSEPMQTERKSSKHTQHRLDLCHKLVSALKLLANKQKDGERPIQSIATGLHERSRRGITDGLRNFIDSDNHSAVDVGYLRRGTKSVSVKKLKFSETFAEATIREGADELTLRAGGRGGDAAGFHQHRAHRV